MLSLVDQKVSCRLTNIGLVLLACLLLCYACSLPLQHSLVTATSHNIRRTNGGQTCGFMGDSDIYGLGIRIGYYTQAIAVWFANFFVVSQASILRSINRLFAFALVVGLVWLSHDPRKVFAIEAWLLNQLLTSTWYIGVVEQSRFSRKYQRFDPVRIIIQNLTFCALWLYMAWYYWVGLDHMKRTPCGTYVLLFVVKLDLFGWYRSLGKICTFLSIPWVLLPGIITMIKLVHHRRTRRLRSSGYAQCIFLELNKKKTNHADCNHASAVSEIPNDRPTETRHEKAKSSVSVEGQLVPYKKTITAQDTLNKHQSQTDSLQASQVQNGKVENGDDQLIFRIAVSTPLPLSPKGTFSGRPPEIYPRTDSNLVYESSATVPTFSSLLAADTYIDEVLEGFEQGKFFGTYSIARTRIRIFYPKIRFFTPRYTARFCKHLFRRRNRPGILVPLFLHLFDSYSHSHHLFPEIFNTAVDHPQYHSIPVEALNVVLSFRMLRLPHSKPNTLYIYKAIMALAACGFVVVAIELAIAWNHIGGLNNVGAVGQLVPAVLGVGGIVKVVWARWTEREVGRREEEAVPEGLRKCAEVYEIMKEEGKGMS